MIRAELENPYFIRERQNNQKVILVHLSTIAILTVMETILYLLTP